MSASLSQSAVEVAPVRVSALDRTLALLVCALPALLSLFFIPASESPFLVPKRALLIAASGALVALCVACGRLRVPLAPSARTWFALALALCVGAIVSWLAAPRRDLGAHAVLFSLAGPLLAWVAMVVV